MLFTIYMYFYVYMFIPLDADPHSLLQQPPLFSLEPLLTSGSMSMAGLPSKKPSGFNVKPVCSAGITGKSSTRGTCVTPKAGSKEKRGRLESPKLCSRWTCWISDTYNATELCSQPRCFDLLRSILGVPPVPDSGGCIHPQDISRSRRRA